VQDKNVSGFEINIGADSVKVFQELVFRATNLWPDAPAEIKEFADIITCGQPMQNYVLNPHLSGKVKPNQSDK
jgi:hypothetical protein